MGTQNRTGRAPFRWLFIPLMVLGAVMFFAETFAADQVSIVTAYQSENTLVRKGALRDAATCSGAWVKDLFTTALNDKSPVVVDVAVQEIGKLKLSSLSGKLIDLYHTADSKFKGYGERVRYAIVPALGKLGTPEAKVFLSDLLQKDAGTYMGRYILLAIQDLNDQSLITGVKQYVHKMEEKVALAKSLQYDPLIYSMPLGYIDLAAQVELALLAKGGDNE